MSALAAICSTSAPARRIASILAMCALVVFAVPAHAAETYTVQVGAFRNLRSAKQARDQLADQVGEARIVPIEIGDGILYRVVSGSFHERDTALAHASQLMNLGHSTYVRAVEQPTEQDRAPETVVTPPAPPADDVRQQFTERLERTNTVKLVEKLGGSAAEDRASELARVDDDRRPDDQLTVELMGKPLTIGGELESKTSYQNDISLGVRDDEEIRIDLHAELELLYRPHPDLAIFAEAKLKQQARYQLEADNSSYDTDLTRGQTWIFWDRIGGSNFGLQVGNQRVRDKREWWWDKNLDAVSLYYHTGDAITAQLGVAEELFGRSTDEEGIYADEKDIFRAFGHLRWNYAKEQRFEAFAMYQDDHSASPDEDDTLPADREDESDADLLWAGLRAMGHWRLENKHRIYYWIDTGFVTGNEDVYDYDDLDDEIEVDNRFRRDVLGWAVDLGATWRTHWEPELNFTLGYAVGSGDRDGSDSDSYDKSYRQTGLQDNNVKFRGVDRFRIYGELLDPELSNLNITTAAIGMPLLEASSIELVHHYYKQFYKSPFLRDSGLSRRPTGDDRDIGHEIDLVLGLEEWKHLEIEAVAALFIAGDAFGSESGDTAQSFSLKLDWNF